jgi:hypothetical protein
MDICVNCGGLKKTITDPYTRIEHNECECRTISRIYVKQDSKGAYKIAAENKKGYKLATIIISDAKQTLDDYIHAPEVAALFGVPLYAFQSCRLGINAPKPVLKNRNGNVYSRSECEDWAAHNNFRELSLAYRQYLQRKNK